jgi:hypothetical protein
MVRAVAAPPKPAKSAAPPAPSVATVVPVIVWLVSSVGLKIEVAEPPLPRKA